MQVDGQFEGQANCRAVQKFFRKQREGGQTKGKDKDKCRKRVGEVRRAGPAGGQQQVQRREQGGQGNQDSTIQPNYQQQALMRLWGLGG